MVKRITFEEIEPVWRLHLWPGRVSPIETHSAMTWPFEGDPEEYDMNIFNYTPTFWGKYVDGVLVGVNSGHRTSDSHYRSRGLWVHPEYRKLGIAQALLTMTCYEAMHYGCDMIWSLPRKTALPTYTKNGFITVGGFIETETADANIYVKKFIAA